VAYQELGDLGTSQSPPALFPWHWYYHAPSAGLWILIVLLLFLVKRTHTARPWVILIALVLAIVLWQMEGFSPLLVSLGVAGIIIWLVGGWLPGVRPPDSTIASGKD
jgi:membrane-bound ClpP family serine protease